MRWLAIVLALIGGSALAESSNVASSPNSILMTTGLCTTTAYIMGQPFTVDTANNAGSTPWALSSQSNPSVKSSLDRFELRVGDKSCNDVAGGDLTVERTELAQSVVANQSATLWAAYSMYFPSTSVFKGGTITGQLHPASCNVNNTVAQTILYMAPNNTTQEMEFTVFNSTQNPMTTQPTQTKVFTDTNTLTNQWVAYVHKITLSPGGSGVWTVWKNGVQLFSYTGSIGFTSCTTDYWKYGMYRSVDAANGTTIAWYANVEVGSTDLTARIASPLPVLVGAVN